MAEVASAVVSLIPSLKGSQKIIQSEVDQAAEGAGKSGGKKLGDGLAGGLKGLAGPLAAAFGGAAVLGAFSNLTSLASDYNETLSKSAAIFGDNEAAMEKWASKAATTVGLSKSAALDAAAGFGDMFSQIGFTGDAAAKMSQQVVQASADLGSFSNLDTADVSDRIAAAFRGEYDSLQAVIPNINAARVESEAMAETGKKNAKSLTAQEKAAAVLAIVQKDGARAMGDFARTSDGAANKSKIQAARMEDLKVKAGQVLLPIKQLALDGFGVLITVLGGVGSAIGSVAGFISSNSTAFTIAAGVITAVFLPALVSMGVKATISAAQTVAGWVTSGAAAVTGAAAQSLAVVKVVAGWVLMGAQSLLAAAKVAASWLIAMGPIGLVIAAVVGLVVIIVKNWDTIKAATAAVWGAVVGFVSSAWDKIKATVSAAVSAVIDFVKSHWGLIVSVIGGPLAAVVVQIVKHWDQIKSAFSTGIKNAVDLVKGLPGKILSALGNLGDLLLNAGKEIIGGLLRGITQKFEDVKDFVGGIGSWIGDHKGPLSYDRKLLVPAGKAIMGGLNDSLRSEMGALARTMSDVTDVVALRAPSSPSLPRLAVPSAPTVRAGSGAGSSTPVVVNVDGRNLFSFVVDHTTRTVRQTGTNPLVTA